MVARVRFVVGAGGAGTSTVAAALALGLRASGRRVLLVCIDDAPNPDLTAGTDLDVEVIDSLAILESRYRTLTTVLSMAGRHDHGSGSSSTGPSLPDPEELTALPVAQELTALLEVYRLARSGSWDEVVIDGPGPTGWRALVTTPSLLAGYLERIWPKHARVVAATGSDTRLAIGVELVDRIDEAAAGAHRALTDRSITSAVVVTRARPSVLRTTRTMLANTVFHGVTVDRVVVNDVAPTLGGVPTSILGTHPAVFWMDRIRAEQQSALATFCDEVAPLRVDAVSTQPSEPVGSAALGTIADELDGSGTIAGSQPLSALTPAVELESGHGVKSVYVMRIPLPLVDADTIDVGRVEDDVIVTAQGGRRRLRLASVLRRCVVTGAEFDDAVLSVRFAPDPALWPEHLHAPTSEAGSDG